MCYNPFSLAHKTIFITGASSGIGRATAIECSKMGATVIITGRDKDRLNSTFITLEGEGHQQIIADLNNSEKIQEMVNLLPLLNGVVHCAGFTKTLPFQFVNSEELNSIMNVNFTAPTILSQQLIKKKKINKNGAFVFISSVSGTFVSAFGNSMYSASKGAINGIVKGMALELASKNIRVNSVCPGMIHTNIVETGVISNDQLMEDMKKYPLKRYGNPEEVAFAIIYLLSDASSWVTGSNILIDGGWTLI